MWLRHSSHIFGTLSFRYEDELHCLLFKKTILQKQPNQTAMVKLLTRNQNNNLQDNKLLRGICVIFNKIILIIADFKLGK